MTAPDISETEYGELYQSMLGEIRMGRFRLDAEDAIIGVDDGWLRLYGFDAGERGSVLRQSIQAFYVDANELRHCDKAKDKQQSIVEHTCLLKKKTGEHFFGRVHTRGIWDEQGRYLGRYGYVRDVTAEEVYRRIDERLPVAFYIARKVHGEDRLVFCNREFLKMYDFDSMTAALGVSMKDFYQDVEDYEAFVAQGKGGGPIPKIRIKVISSQGRPFTQEAHVYFDGNERYGVLRDASKEDRLFAAVANVNLTIHTYHTAIHGLVLFTEVFIKFLLKDETVDIDAVVWLPEKGLLETKIKSLMALYAELEQLAQERGQKKLLKPLDRSIAILTGRLYADFPWEALLDSKLDSVLRIMNYVEGDVARTHFFKRELLREIRDQAMDVGNTILLLMLYRIRRNLIELGEEIQNLLTYATDASKQLNAQRKEVLDFWQLVREVLNREQAFADTSHIDLRYHATVRNALVWGRRAELASAISGLIHNAIKYSWQRRNGYVTVRLGQTTDSQGQTWLQLSISNYGVMIGRDEIESGDIFRYGYRGRYASDRSRPGSGIGLYYAKRVIEDHGGRIAIASIPARSSASHEPLRNRPHITTVTVHLPLYNETKEKTE